MIYVALTTGDWAAFTVLLVIVGSVLGGLYKFIQAIKILRKGRPQIDPELATEQERAAGSHELD